MERERGGETDKRTPAVSGPITGRRAAFMEVLVGLSGQISSISGRFTGMGIDGTQAELLLPGRPGAVSGRLPVPWLCRLALLVLREGARDPLGVADGLVRPESLLTGTGTN